MTGESWDSGHPLQKVCFRWGWPTGNFFFPFLQQQKKKKKKSMLFSSKKNCMLNFLLSQFLLLKNWPQFWSLAGQETNIFLDGLT